METPSPQLDVQLLMANIGLQLTQHVDPDDVPATIAALETELRRLDGEVAALDIGFVRQVRQLSADHERTLSELEMNVAGIRAALANLTGGRVNRVQRAEADGGWSDHLHDAGERRV